MDYKQKAMILRVCSNKKGERCSSCPAFGQEERHCRRNAMRDGADAIEQLITRVEAAEHELDELRKPNCLMCDSMHQNGNCIEIGGFFTSVPAAYCPLIPKLIERVNRVERALAHMWYAYENKDGKFPHEYEVKAVEEAERILGKWVDVMPGVMREDQE